MDTIEKYSDPNLKSPFMVVKNFSLGGGDVREGTNP